MRFEISNEIRLTDCPPGLYRELALPSEPTGASPGRQAGAGLFFALGTLAHHHPYQPTRTTDSCLSTKTEREKATDSCFLS